MLKAMPILAATFLYAHALFAQDGTETRTIARFHSLEAKGALNVVITEGNSTTAKLEGDAEVLNKIELQVENGVLKIGWKEKNVKMNWKAKPTTVYVETRELRNLAVNGSGNVTAKGNFTAGAEFNLATNGSGNISFGNVAANKINMAVNGSGNCTIGGGRVQEINISVAGSGNINASGVEAAEANVIIRGSGNTNVFATKALNAMVQGSGMVRYKGNPEVQTTSKNKVQKI